MHSLAAPSEREAGVAFLAQLAQLLSEVEAINRQLERIDNDVQRALNEAARERFETYC